MRHRSIVIAAAFACALLLMLLAPAAKAAPAAYGDTDSYFIRIEDITRDRWEVHSPLEQIFCIGLAKFKEQNHTYFGVSGSEDFAESMMMSDDAFLRMDQFERRRRFDEIYGHYLDLVDKMDHCALHNDARYRIAFGRIYYVGYDFSSEQINVSDASPLAKSAISSIAGYRVHYLFSVPPTSAKVAAEVAEHASKEPYLLAALDYEIEGIDGGGVRWACWPGAGETAKCPYKGDKDEFKQQMLAPELFAPSAVDIFVKMKPVQMDVYDSKGDYLFSVDPM